jgi:hypothetical protein
MGDDKAAVVPVPACTARSSLLGGCGAMLPGAWVVEGLCVLAGNEGAVATAKAGGAKPSGVVLVLPGVASAALASPTLLVTALLVLANDGSGSAPATEASTAIGGVWLVAGVPLVLPAP